MLEDAVYTHEWLLFISLCETGSMKESAELFSLSTSAASRALKRLEDTLEVTLFDRCSKPMTPTPDGKILYSRVKTAMKSTREALENVREKNSLHSELKIGFLESMSLSIV
ncbi:LysR family transcriptional regulator, partial [Turicimonas muris]